MVTLSPPLRRTALPMAQPLVSSPRRAHPRHRRPHQSAGKRSLASRPLLPWPEAFHRRPRLRPAADCNGRTLDVVSIQCVSCGGLQRHSEHQGSRLARNDQCQTAPNDPRRRNCFFRPAGAGSAPTSAPTTSAGAIITPTSTAMRRACAKASASSAVRRSGSLAGPATPRPT